MKKQHWQQALVTTMQSLEGVRFKWGINDCCTLVADAMDAQYGSSLRQQLNYRGERGAAEFIQQRGGDIAACLSHYLIEKNPAFVQRGDAVTFEGENGMTAGIYWVVGVWATSPEGARLFSDVKITGAWGGPRCHQQ